MHSHVNVWPVPLDSTHQPDLVKLEREHLSFQNGFNFDVSSELLIGLVYAQHEVHYNDPFFASSSLSYLSNLFLKHFLFDLFENGPLVELESAILQSELLVFLIVYRNDCV